MAEFFSAGAAVAIFSNCPFPLIIVSDAGRVTCFNAAFETLVGEEQAARCCGTDSPADVEPGIRALLSNSSLVCWTDRDNRVRWFEIIRVALPEHGHSEARFFVETTRQVELHEAHNRLENELKDSILTDTVTGLLNSRGMALALEPQVARSRRYNSPISIVMFAIDGEHDRDGLMVAVARLLKDKLRWADLVACNERREFVLALPETSEESALALAGKLRQQLFELIRSFDRANPSWPSYGISAWHKRDSAETLLNRAATALAKARSGQRHGQSVAL